MTTRNCLAPVAFALLCALAVLAPSASATVTAKLRVLTPDRVLDPGTTYIVDEGVTVPTRADADCFGPPGGSGAEFTYEKPNALSLLATRGPDDQAGRAARAHRPVRLRARNLRRSAAPPPSRARAFGTSRPTTRRPRSAPTSSRSTTATRSSSTSRRTTSRTRIPPSSSSRRPAGVKAGTQFAVTRDRAQVRHRPGHVRDHLQQRPGGRGHGQRRRRARDHRRRRHRSAQRRRGRRADRWRPPAAPTSRPRRSRSASAPRRTRARRRGASASSAARRPTGSRAPPATTRSARAAATTRSTCARAAPTRSTAARAATWSGSKRKFANDGLVIKGSCERVRSK